MNIAIIAAAGAGIRMGAARPKQLLELGGIPVLVHTLRRFESCPDISEVIVVLPSAETASFLSAVGKYGLKKVARVVPGGATRAESVWRGLQSTRAATAEFVVVHDGVRPFVSPSEITCVIEAAREHGAAILVAPVTETIKQVDGGFVETTLDRDRLRRSLTPQCFRYGLLVRAFESAGALLGEATDECVLVERLGMKVAAVEGDPRNIKITRPEDLEIARVLLDAFSGN